MFNVFRFVSFGIMFIYYGCAHHNTQSPAVASGTSYSTSSTSVQIPDMVPDDPMNHVAPEIKELVNVAKEQLYFDYIKRNKRSKKVALDSTLLPKVAKDSTGRPKLKDYPRAPSGQCYLFVKAALYKAGLVADKLSGKSAKHAGSELEAHGFQKIQTSPEEAPIGAILVYKGYGKGATRRYGHIEIKVSSNEFASDCMTNLPNNHKKRALIGIYFKG